MLPVDAKGELGLRSDAIGCIKPHVDIYVYRTAKQLIIRVVIPIIGTRRKAKTILQDISETPALTTDNIAPETAIDGK